MKKFANHFVLFLIGISFTAALTGCGKEERDQNEFAVGNWTQLRNRAYILLITSPKGEWSSSVRIADATSRIVKSKGNAKGTWHIDSGQIFFSVTETEIEEVWEKNATLVFDIVELTEAVMQLKSESGRTIVWKQTKAQTAAASEESMTPVLPMGPVVVNLNKNRSNDPDRYLCLNLNLVLKELMPDQEIPVIHPKAREAAIIFLSSLVSDDVKDFDSINKRNKELIDVLNPYMEGAIDEVIVEQVIVASEMDKVEEFIIEHTLGQETAPEEGEEEK